MLYILKTQTTFEQLAQMMAQTGLDLVNVRSCTFPSRPEPKQAQWAGIGGAVMSYVYEPDIELRFLWQCGQWPRTLDMNSETYFHIHAHLFDTWESLMTHLHSTSYPHVVRAASAWRVRALKDKNHQQRLDAQRTLLGLLKTSKDVHTQRVVAQQLYHCAGQDMLEELRQLHDSDQDIEVRLHLHRTLEHVMAKQLF